MAAWAAVEVSCWIIEEFVLGEATLADSSAALRTGDVRRDTDSLAGCDILALIVSHVGHRIDPLDTEQFSGRTRSLRQQTKVAAGVSNMLLDDQLVLGIDGNLRVLADTNFWMGRHSARIGVRQRYLALAAGDQLGQHGFKCLATLTHLHDFRRQRGGAQGSAIAFGFIGTVEAG